MTWRDLVAAALLSTMMVVRVPGARASFSPADGGASVADAEAAFRARREAMVEDQLVRRGIRDARVLAAMRAVPRHHFVPERWVGAAYADSPVPIGLGQTISQPFVVAFMAEALRLRGGERVLEVGSGSGYAAAILSRLAADVYGIELEEELHRRSVEVIEALGYRNVHLRAGDGFHGWPESAPFDAILLSCAAEELPEPLWAQLRVGGVLVYPRGPPGGAQELVHVEKTATGRKERRLELVQFVPMRRAAP